MKARDIQARLQQLGNQEIARALRGFFKTGPGQYGEGDVWGDEDAKRAVYDLYLANTARVNNWDLVDSSAEHVVGGYLADKDRGPLYRLARSGSLWERRVAVIATFHFIRRGDFADTLELARMLLEDKEDLIHKAVGWMLREVGKRDPDALEAFLGEHHRQMPRTMLRYAIERLPEPRRQQYRVHTRADLARLGPVAAYRMIKMRQDKASLNLLYALQAALDEVRWTALPPGLKERLRQEADEMNR